MDAHGGRMRVHESWATLMDAHGAVGGKRRQGSAATTMTLMGPGAWEFMRVAQRSWTLMAGA